MAKWTQYDLWNAIPAQPNEFKSGGRIDPSPLTALDRMADAAVPSFGERWPVAVAAVRHGVCKAGSPEIKGGNK